MFTYPVGLLSPKVGDISRDGLVGEWLFDGNADDTSGEGNDGTVSGATLTTNRHLAANKAYAFDGNDSILMIDSYDFNNAFSVSLWVKTSSGVRQGVVNSRFGSGKGWRIEIISDIIRFWIYDGLSDTLATSITPINDNNWHHIVVVSNVSTGWNLDLYFDSIIDGTGSNVARSNMDNLPKLRFGDEGSSQLQPYTGDMDDIRLYDRALTPEEITALYNE